MKKKKFRAGPFLAAAVLCACGAIVFMVHAAEAPSGGEEKAPEKDSPKPGGEAAVPDAPPAKDGGDSNVIAVAPPPFSKGIFPCSGCHEDLKTNPTPRKLTKKHKEIVLHHDENNRWCLACHSAEDRDKLHLAGGTLIDFTESYRLCGQCHGPTLRDWKAGEHGKRTGSWSGKKQYLLCAHCHDPHSPRFQPLKPLPPPVRPESLR